MGRKADAPWAWKEREARRFPHSLLASDAPDPRQGGPGEAKRAIRGERMRACMVIKYCEFEPTQHRNKRVAAQVFLDEPGDPHPLAICDVCSKKLLMMRPDAIVMDRKEFLAQKKKGKEGESAAAPAKGAEADVAPTDE